MLRNLSLSNASKDPHNVFLICHSLNKRKADQPLHSSKLITSLTDEGKGSIARAMLYMKHKYGIKIDDHDLMKLWNKLYKPSVKELERYNILKIKYGINPYLETST
jgi:endonuclease I